MSNRSGSPNRRSAYSSSSSRSTASMSSRSTKSRSSSRSSRSGRRGRRLQSNVYLRAALMNRAKKHTTRFVMMKELKLKTVFSVTAEERNLAISHLLMVYHRSIEGREERVAHELIDKNKRPNEATSSFSQRSYVDETLMVVHTKYSVPKSDRGFELNDNHTNSDMGVAYDKSTKDQLMLSLSTDYSLRAAGEIVHFRQGLWIGFGNGKKVELKEKRSTSRVRKDEPNLQKEVLLEESFLADSTKMKLKTDATLYNLKDVKAREKPLIVERRVYDYSYEEMKKEAEAAEKRNKTAARVSPRSPAANDDNSDNERPENKDASGSNVFYTFKAQDVPVTSKQSRSRSRIREKVEARKKGQVRPSPRYPAFNDEMSDYDEEEGEEPVENQSSEKEVSRSFDQENEAVHGTESSVCENPQNNVKVRICVVEPSPTAVIQDYNRARANMKIPSVPEPRPTLGTSRVAHVSRSPQHPNALMTPTFNKAPGTPLRSRPATPPPPVTPPKNVPRLALSPAPNARPYKPGTSNSSILLQGPPPAVPSNPTAPQLNESMYVTAPIQFQMNSPQMMNISTPVLANTPVVLHNHAINLVVDIGGVEHLFTGNIQYQGAQNLGFVPKKVIIDSNVIWQQGQQWNPDGSASQARLQ